MSDFVARLDALKAENVSLHAETLALQTLLFSLIIALHKSGAVPPRVIDSAFEVASEFLSALAVRVDRQDMQTLSGDAQTIAALRIVEEFRAEFDVAK